MRPTLANRLERALEKSHWLRPGDRVGVAVSGGADSVALLLLLTELRKNVGLVLAVVHFNHKLRGRASDTDERAVAKLANRFGLTLHLGQGDVKAKARREKANLEDAARRARYEFFEHLVSTGKLDKIAVAHTSDDQAETVMAHLLRGTGLAGLGGIHPVVGHVIRPLLGFRRAELRAYLRSRKQTWRDDATNRDTTRLRARIRKKLLPLLEKQFQPEIVQHLTTLADLARADTAFLDAFAEARLCSCSDPRQDCARIPLADVADPNRTHPAIAARMIRLAVKRVKPSSGQLTSQHVDAVLELARTAATGKHLPLPGGLEVRREHDALLFQPASVSGRTPKRRADEFAFTLDLSTSDTRIAVQKLNCAFRFRVIDWSPNTSDTIETRSVLDRDALPAPFVLRNWRPGDRFRPLGHRSSHKLKQLLRKLRISGDRRVGWPVLTAGDKIAWCRGLPIAAEFVATEGTRFGLVVSEESVS